MTGRVFLMAAVQEDCLGPRSILARRPLSIFEFLKLGSELI